MITRCGRIISPLFRGRSVRRMLEKIMRRYAMSREGAKGFINSVCACTVSDLVLMFPVELLYTLTEDMLNNGVNSGRIVFYIVRIIVLLICSSVILHRVL